MFVTLTATLVHLFLGFLKSKRNFKKWNKQVPIETNLIFWLSFHLNYYRYLSLLHRFANHATMLRWTQCHSLGSCSVAFLFCLLQHLAYRAIMLPKSILRDDCIHLRIGNVYRIFIFSILSQLYDFRQSFVVCICLKKQSCLVLKQFIFVFICFHISIFSLFLILVGFPFIEMKHLLYSHPALYN